MKFDIDRAMAWVQVFDFPRGTGSKGERRAADLLAEHFEKQGWRVNRVRTRTGCPFSTLIMILLLTLILEGYFLWRALRLSVPGGSRRERTVYLLAGLILTGLSLSLTVGRQGVRVARDRFLAWRSAKARSPLENIVACRPGSSEPSSRVVVLSHLDTPLPVLVREDGVCAGMVLVLLALSILGRSRVGSAWFAVGIVVTTLVFQVRYWLRAGTTSSGDNRTGLAVLAELSQAFPTRVHERVEILLAAVGGNSAGQVGALTLADEIRRRSSDKPTLIINLDAPGLGRELRLVGKGRALEVAQSAAKDLWVPHRVSRSPFCVLDHRPFQLNAIPAVSLSGDRKGTKVEPAALAASAQLVSEMMLRWARETRRQEPAQPETLPKSSQNPG